MQFNVVDEVSPDTKFAPFRGAATRFGSHGELQGLLDVRFTDRPAGGSERITPIAKSTLRV
jgi:hypothetical protein